MDNNANQVTFLSKFHKKHNLFIPVSFIMAILIFTYLIYDLFEVDHKSYIVGIIMSIVATAFISLVSVCHKGLLEYRTFSSFSESISGKKTTIDVSFVFSVYKFRDECAEILSRNGMGFEYCFQKYSKNTEQSSNPDIQQRIWNQKQLVARDDLESLISISNKMWDMHQVVPEFRDYSQIFKYGENDYKEIIPGNYITIGLFGNELTEYYCSLENSLFKLSEQNKETHGKLSIYIGKSKSTVFQQITDYPIDKKTKVQIPGGGRGLDYGIIARHFVPFLSNKNHACWFIGGLAGAGTLAASKYFQNHYDEFISEVKKKCKVKKISFSRSNFIIVIAVERNNLEYIIPNKLFLMNQNGYEILSEIMCSDDDISKINYIIQKTEKQIEDTEKEKKTSV
ncbi:membrane protein [Candidatus Magnetomorum sp. HK-1]|nr:membrane protein [Candidatus Magnetomorum sp. HK-1]